MKFLIELGKYHNTKLSVQLYDRETNEPYARLSVNTEHQMHPNEFVVKAYSENKGLDNLSLYDGWFEDTGRRVDIGPFVKNAPVWRLAPASQS